MGYKSGMERKSVVEEKGLKPNQNRQAESLRTVATCLTATYERMLNDHLGENCFLPRKDQDGKLLPIDRFGEALEDEDIGHYVKERLDTGSDVGVYEKKLHDAICPCSGRETHPIVSLVAGEGTGKTTLLRYFFDYYLKRLQNLANQSKHDKFIKQKIVLYKDLMTDTRLVFVFDALKNIIAEKFPNIDTEQDLAMWNRKARWGANHHELSRRSLKKEICEYRNDYVEQQGYRNDSRVWVKEAVWYLRIHKKKYVVLFWDNLDQTKPSMQEEVVETLLEWANQESESDRTRKETGYLKFILPVRKITFELLKLRINPAIAEHITQISLEKIDEAKMLGQRTDVLNREINSSRVIARHRQQVDMKGKILWIYRPVSRTQASSTFKLMLKSLPICNDDSRKLSAIATPLKDYCHGSIRRALRLHKRLLKSAAGGVTLHNLMQGKREDISQYKYLDGIICGNNKWYNEDADYDMPNLYRIAENQEQKIEDYPYSIWCGPCLIKYLGWYAYDTIDYQILVNDFMKLYFTEKEITSSLEKLEKSCLIKIDEYMNVKRIHLYTAAMQGLWKIFLEPAYTDNMAIVTPVEQKYRLTMQTTSGTIRQDYYDRTMTTLEFICQLRDDSDMVLGLRKEGSRCPDPIGRHAIANHLQGLGLDVSSFIPSIKEKYAERILILSATNKPGLSDGQWQKIMTHPAIEESINEYNYPNTRPRDSAGQS